MQPQILNHCSHKCLFLKAQIKSNDSNNKTATFTHQMNFRDFDMQIQFVDVDCYCDLRHITNVKKKRKQSENKNRKKKLYGLCFYAFVYFGI